MAQCISYASRHVLLEKEALAGGNAQPLLFYNHIPKCGGLSLTHMLKGCYAHSCDVHHNIFDPKATPLDKLFYHGHGVSGLEQYIPAHKQYFYITVLRHPWALAQSLIRFFRWLTPLDPFYQQAPEKILLSQRPNMLIHYLGNGDKELAEENLLHKYVFFGLQEYFTESLHLLAQSIPALQQQEMPAKNVSAKEKWTLDAQCKKDFFERNALDVELYTKAEKEFLHRAGIEKRPQQKISAEEILPSSNAHGGYQSTVQALKESIAHDEDLPYMDAPQARFENWLYILLHSMTSESEYEQFYAWLQKRSKNRLSCLYFAYECAKKSTSPVLMQALPLQAQMLFGLCNQRDKDNACRILVECRLDIIELWLQRQWYTTYKHFDLTAYKWLCALQKQQAWQNKALLLQEQLLQYTQEVTRQKMHALTKP